MKRSERINERETFHLDIPADENNLTEVRDFIASICERAGFSKSEINNTKLAVDEACTNIIKHAYKDKGGEIRIDVQAEPGKVEINIFDRGEPFDWSAVQEPDLDHYVEIGKRGGLGIFLMSRIMDSLNYSPSPAGNRMYMMKRSGTVAQMPLFGSIMRPRWTSTLRFKFAMRATLGLLGLVSFLWIILFYRQTIELRERIANEWLQRKRMVEIIAGSSVGALTKDPFDVSALQLSTDMIPRQMSRYPEVKYIRVVHRDGRIFASNKQEEFLARYDFPEEIGSIEQTGAYRTIESDSLGKIREFHQPVYISEVDRGGAIQIGRVVVGISEARVSAEIADPRPMMTLLLIGVFAAGVALLYLLVAVFVRPIQALTDGVRAIGEGSLEDEIQITGPQEIGEIARAFNEITAKFREAQKNVVEQERLHKEMQVAQEIQQTLLPKRVPEISGYDIASLYRAAKEVGGDYYDFVHVDDDTLGVVVADVSGKGVPGSLVMTMIRTALRMEARGNYSAAEVMARMNDFVTEDMKKGMFVTIFYAILDSKNRIISYSSAGHNPMILYRAESDETYFLNPRGFPVGIKLPDDTLFRRSIDVEKIKLKKDDMLVIYTDGVTEAMNSNREQYGEERLIRLIKECGRMSPQEFVDRLNEDIKAFTGDQPQNDDITVVAIKEKLMADEVLYGIRKKLLELVEIQKVPVAEACRMMHVSPSTYYRYKKRLSELGDRGLQDKTLRREVDIRRVSLEQRKEILKIVRENPRFGAKKIAELFNAGKKEQDHLNPAMIYDELRRLRLNTYELRLEYLRRNRLITEDQYREMLAGRPAPAAPKETRPLAESLPVKEVHPAKAERMPSVKRVERLRPRAPLREAFEQSEGRTLSVSSEELEGGIVAINVAGHLDSFSTGELETALERVSEYGYRKIIVDLSLVTYISSGGWGIFTGRVKSLRDAGGDVVLCGMSPEVYDIYDLLGFQQIIMQFPNKECAVEFLKLPQEERSRKLEESSKIESRIGLVEVRQASGESESRTTASQEEADSALAGLRIQAGTVGSEGEIAVLYLDGVIDTVSCSKLRSVIESLLDRGTSKIVVDMSRVEYVSSSGWGVFASRIKDIRNMGGDIKIFGMDPEVDGIFHMLGFDSIMRSFGILTEAIEDFANPAPALPGEGIPEEELEEAQQFVAIPDGAETASSISLDDELQANTGATVLRIQGALDSSTCDKLNAQFEQLLETHPAVVIFDLSHAAYISSSGWGAILKCMQKQNERNGRFALAEMNPAVRKIFADLDLASIVPNFDRLKEAISALSPRTLQGVERELATKRQDSEVKAASKEREPSKAELKGIIVGEPLKVDAKDFIGEVPIEPLKPVERSVSEEKVVFIDFKSRVDVREDKDKRLRNMGWDRYGKRLTESIRKPRRKR